MRFVSLTSCFLLALFASEVTGNHKNRNRGSLLRRDGVSSLVDPPSTVEMPEAPDFVPGMPLTETDEEITENENVVVENPWEIEDSEDTPEDQDKEREAAKECAIKLPPKDFPPYQPPDNRTLDQWLSTYGMSEKAFQRVKRLVHRLKRAEAIKLGKDPPTQKQMGNDIRYAGVVMTYRQLRRLLNSQRNHRKKRKTINFLNYPFNKWPSTTINYVFSPSHPNDGVKMIRAAMAEIEEATCIRFAESNNGRYLYYNNYDSGCWSYVGRTGSSGPQIVNMETSSCTGWLGGPVHEILHALGLMHEQSRPDRDSYVSVNLANVLAGFENNFLKETFTTASTHGIDYDYGSVMHYGSGDFAKGPAYVITTLDPGFQKTIGQRVTLSWHDAKAINTVYCNDVCSSFPQLTCSNGGYMDPNTCTSCRCPEGFGGILCDIPAANNGACTPLDNSDILIENGNEVCVQSRNYGNGVYNNDDNCAYQFTAPEGCQLTSRFDGVFGTHCYKQNSFPTCFQWVEIKIAADMSKRGYRFCCPGSTPTTNLVSTSNKMLVHFDATYPRVSNAYTTGDLWPGTSSRTGFKVCVKIQDTSCLPATTTPIAESTTAPPLPTTTILQTTPVPTAPVFIGCRYYCWRDYSFRCYYGTPCKLYFCCLYRNPDGTYFRKCRFIKRRCA